MTATGALLFGRYAFPPNRLGYCGPDDNQALFQYVADKSPDRGLVELERRFEGAYPYLALIAQANGIADPFDDRVVEAYWIGNDCLEQVKGVGFYDSLRERFAPRMAPNEFKWLASKLESGARPHHNFHVFDVYVRAGFMRDERASIALDTMDSCRVSWGRVVEVAADQLVVDRCPLVLKDGKLALADEERVAILRQFDGRGFVDDVKPGRNVSIHWSWACDVLTNPARARLRAETLRCLALANQTI